MRCARFLEPLAALRRDSGRTEALSLAREEWKLTCNCFLLNLQD